MSKPKESIKDVEKNEPKSYRQKTLQSNSLVVFIVYVTLMTDTILYSAIVPILPKYFYVEAISHAVNVSESPTVNQTSDVSIFDKNDCPKVATDALLATENIQLSLLLASKQLIQIFANLAVGPVIDKIGCNVPMFIGYVIMVTSSLAFAFGKSYAILLTARSLQGVGSACATTAGMVMIADRFRDDEQRGKMLGIALGGFGLGVMVGPPFGSAVYQFGGKAAPFIVLAALSFAIGLLQLAASKLRIKSSETMGQVKSAHIILLKDPYVLLSSFAVICGGLPVAVIEASLPLWMMMTLCSEEWMLGLIFLPGSVGFILSSMFCGWLGHYIGRWTLCLLSFVLSIAAVIGMPFSLSFSQLIGPTLVMGIAGGLLDATMYPIFGFLVDKRFDLPIYGGAYALADAMFCVSYSLGPLLAGFAIPAVGFERLMFITAGITLLGIVPLIFLRKALATDDLCCSSCLPEKDGEQTILLKQKEQLPMYD